MATAALAALAGCGARPSAEDTTQHVSAIVAGVASTSDDDAVVLVRHLVLGSESVCSGTLVAPNLVITARHCVSYSTGGLYQCSPNGELIEGPDGGGQNGADVPASAVEIHVGPLAVDAPAALGKQILSTLSQSSCIDDVAFVVLDRALMPPFTSIRFDRQTRVGERVTLIGYGGEQADAVLDWHAHPRTKLPHQIISAVGADSATGSVPTVVPRTIEIQGASVCVGDSGGPALSEETGAAIGIFSNTSASDCRRSDSTHSYTNLAPFERLALQAFAAAGAQPIREPPGLASGEACQSDSDCNRGACVTGADGTPRCAVTCNPTTPCPGGFSCILMADAGIRYCLSERPPACDCDTGLCQSCDGGQGESPSPASDSGGCAIRRPPLGSGASLVVALASLVWMRFGRLTGRRARRHPARNR